VSRSRQEAVITGQTPTVLSSTGVYTNGVQGRTAVGGGVCSLMYMATRTQIYLTDEQRAQLAEQARAKGVPMSQLIRDAVDSFLGAGDDLDATFGSAPDIAGRVPTRAEWDRHG
jgi:hypothetical protein